MALRHAFRTLPQLAARDTRVRAGSRGAAGGEPVAGAGQPRVLRQVQCGDAGPPPPCPPCPPAPRPCCRQTTPPSQYRLNVYCRPPPASRAPPCPAAPPACPRSCSNYRTSGADTSGRDEPASRDPCDAEAVRDRVWRRVEAARAARREAYLQDVNRKEEEGGQKCGEGYYSADGRSYHRDPPPAPRTPPPPHLVPRPGMRAACQPQHEPGMSPCEHRPPVTVTVLRDRQTSSSAPSSPRSHDTPATPDGTSCGRRNSPPGERSWCNQPVPLASPPRCSGASFAERLRRRAAAPPPCAPLPPSKVGAPRRELHTCESRTSLEEESRRLAGVMTGRGGLHEAGRGRESVAGGPVEGRAFVGHVVVRAVSNERAGGGLRLEMSFDNDLFKFDTDRSASTSGRCPHCSGALCGGGCGASSAGKVARPATPCEAATPASPAKSTLREVKAPATSPPRGCCGGATPASPAKSTLREVKAPATSPPRGCCGSPVTGKAPTPCGTPARPSSVAAQKKQSCSERPPATKVNKCGADPCAALINKIFEPRGKPDPKKK